MQKITKRTHFQTLEGQVTRTSVQLRSFRKCEWACRYYGEEGFDLVIDLEDGWRLAG